MKMLITLICIAAGSTLFFSTNVFAASRKCTIVKIEGNKMILDCPKGTDRFKKGWKIKIKSSEQKKIEGC